MQTFQIEESNISIAWLKVLNQIAYNSGKEITPLVISLTGFNELLDVKYALDQKLTGGGNWEIDTVAETIFPQSLYNYLKKDRFNLYNEYKNNFERIKKIESQNRRGTYFGRMICYENNGNPVNQLEIIISSLNDEKSSRRSKLQASIFDPTRDHTNQAYQGFPCLQHVTFYKTKEGELILNSFYAIQLLIKKAYGNWLGLINLGKFVAEQTNLKFGKLNLFVGVESMEAFTKSEAKYFLNQFEPLIK